MTEAGRDQNYVPTILGVSSADGKTPVTIYVDPSTHRVLTSSVGGTTPGGADTQVQFNDAGTLQGDAGMTYIKATNILTVGGILVSDLTASELTATDASKNLQSLAVATYPSLTEISYVKGVTSAIQTQLDSKGTGDGDALVANPLSQFAATTSLQLKGVISDETGSGVLVFATSPDLAGTPTVSSNIIYYATGTDVPVTDGGTGASDASTARTNLGLAIGSDVQAWDEHLDDLAALTPASSYIVGDGLGGYEMETPATVFANIKQVATSTATGVVELATAAEIDTGTDAVRAMPIDQFVASKRNIRYLSFILVEAGTDCAIATNIAGDFVSPIAGTILQSDSAPYYIYSANSTAGVTGAMVVDVNINGTSIMTTNKIDTATAQKNSYTSSTHPDLTTTALAVGDIISIDIDSIHTTAAKGLIVYIAIRE